jgi:NADPH2:quinone reductase
MKAVILRTFGGPENLELAEVPKPVPGPGQVLVRVKAASVNPVDFKIRNHGSWAGLPMPAILGYDAAGIVEAVGARVEHLKPGDEVFYSARIFGRQGTYASWSWGSGSPLMRAPRSRVSTEAEHYVWRIARRRLLRPSAPASPESRW